MLTQISNVHAEKNSNALKKTSIDLKNAYGKVDIAILDHITP